MTTVQEELPFCQAKGTGGKKRGSVSIAGLLALVFLWVSVQLMKENLRNSIAGLLALVFLWVSVQPIVRERV
jgi:hypothetical protein